MQHVYQRAHRDALADHDQSKANKHCRKAARHNGSAHDALHAVVVHALRDVFRHRVEQDEADVLHLADREVEGREGRERVAAHNQSHQCRLLHQGD